MRSRLSLCLLLLPLLASAEDTTTRLDWRDARLFAEVLETVRREYVQPVEERVLVEQALRGMVGQLDPHSSFLDRAAYAQLRTFTTGVFEGVGLDVTVVDGAVRVIAPLDDSPASRAGLRPGDVLLSVDGMSFNGLTLDEVTLHMRGAPGSKVRLGVQRGDAAPFEVELTRERLRIRSVRSRDLGDGFTQLRVTQFSDTTAADLERELKRLLARGKPAGIVLDLRNNAGGVLEAAVDVADLFLDSGLIVSAEGRAADARFTRSAKPGDLLDGAPVVVLVNAGTASAAEIVAGALQDHARGLLVGERTFGKGSVQTIIPLEGEVAIKLTTSLYFTPKGRSIQAEGIRPDVPLLPVQLDPVAERGALREADLANHLGGSNDGTGAINLARALLAEDPALYQALNALRILGVRGP